MIQSRPNWVDSALFTFLLASKGRCVQNSYEANLYLLIFLEMSYPSNVKASLN